MGTPVARALVAFLVAFVLISTALRSRFDLSYNDSVDVAEELVNAAKRRLRTAQVAPAESLPFLDDTFDVVILGEILEHVHDPEAVIFEAARVSRRLVVGSTPHEKSQWGPGQKKGPEQHRFHVR